MSKYLNGILGNAKYYSGYDKSDNETIRERLDQCKTCSQKIVKNNKIYCNKCGCDLLKKASIKSEQCPLNKWD